MADGRHFEKTVKSPYLCNRVTDFDEIWRGNETAPYSGLTVKMSNFENPRWRRPPY